MSKKLALSTFVPGIVLVVLGLTKVIPIGEANTVLVGLGVAGIVTGVLALFIK